VPYHASPPALGLSKRSISKLVIPAKAGTQLGEAPQAPRLFGKLIDREMGPRFRGDDEKYASPTRSRRPQTQLGSRCCHRLPCRRTSIRSPRLATWPRFLVSAARYARAVRRRRQVSRFAPFGSSCDVPPFAPFRSNCPKTLRPSRIAPPLGPESPWNLAFRFVRIVLRRSSLGAAPAEPPEGISSIAICFARPARKLPWHRSVPLGLVRRPTRASRLGRRGRARSSEESQRSRPPAALRRSSAEACYLRCVAAVPLSFPRLPGSMNSVPSRPAPVRPKAFRSRSVRQMHSPAVALARSIRTQQRCRPYLETAFLPLRVGRKFRRSSS